jgi:hypothetical protein
MDLNTIKTGPYRMRWRGNVEGPVRYADIERRLAAREIGMLHEIEWSGQWISLREFLALCDQQAAAEQAAQQARAQAVQQEQQRQTELQQAAVEEERRRNDILEVNLKNAQSQPGTETFVAPSGMAMASHRGGLILTFALIGMFVMGPFCLAAWIMGNNDIARMDLGQMDPSGRGTTTAGRTIGAIGTVIWAVAIAVLLAGI